MSNMACHSGRRGGQMKMRLTGNFYKSMYACFCTYNYLTTKLVSGSVTGDLLD